MAMMQDIEYGFKDELGNNLINDLEKWDNEFNNFYYLQTPEELLKTKCGVCWDQVELERKLFQDENIACQTYFIFMVDNDMLPSHTFLTFQDNNKYYWFEHSWGVYQGIHEYNTKEELLKDVISKFKADHEEVASSAPLYLYEYVKPQDHLTCDEFYQYIETQKLIVGK